MCRRGGGQHSGFGFLVVMAVQAWTDWDQLYHTWTQVVETTVASALLSRMAGLAVSSLWPCELKEGVPSVVRGCHRLLDVGVQAGDGVFCGVLSHFAHSHWDLHSESLRWSLQLPARELGCFWVNLDFPRHSGMRSWETRSFCPELPQASCASDPCAYMGVPLTSEECRDA